MTTTVSFASASDTREQRGVEAVGVGDAGLGDHEDETVSASAVRTAEAIVSGVAVASTAAR